MPGIKVEKSFTSLTPPKPSRKKDRAVASEPDWSPPAPSFFVEVEVEGLNQVAVGTEFQATVKCRLTASTVREREGRGKRRTYDIDVLAMRMGK